MGQPARKRPSVPILRPLLFSAASTTHTTTPPSPPPTTTTHARGSLSTGALSEEERLLAGQLEEVWRFRGAAEFVAELGFDAVAELVTIVSAEIEQGQVDNPPAFLRWLAGREAV